MKPEEIVIGRSYYSNGDGKRIGGPYIVDAIYKHAKTGKTLASYRLGTKKLTESLDKLASWLVSEYV